MNADNPDERRHSGRCDGDTSDGDRGDADRGDADSGTADRGNDDGGNTGVIEDIDWDRVRQAARDVCGRAYAPYSNFPVGVAGLTLDGRIVTGCNVENASYGVGLCAECGMVSQLHATGGGRLLAVACVDGAGRALMPCGRCRQLLWEHGGPDCLVDTPAGVKPMTAVLPDAFDAGDLSSGGG